MNTLLDKDDPILRQTAEPITESEFGSSWLKELIKTMFNIMADKGAVGVAAPKLELANELLYLVLSIPNEENLNILFLIQL